jgi:hypothetical protein
MAQEPDSLLDLCRRNRADPPWLVNLVLPEIGGGRLDESQLAVIGENASARALRISGLDQATSSGSLPDTARSSRPSSSGSARGSLT